MTEVLPSLHFQPVRAPGQLWTRVDKVLQEHEYVTGALLAAEAAIGRQIACNHLTYLHNRGFLKRVARGLYARGDRPAKFSGRGAPADAPCEPMPRCKGYRVDGSCCFGIAARAGNGFCYPHRHQHKETSS